MANVRRGVCVRTRVNPSFHTALYGIMAAMTASATPTARRRASAAAKPEAAPRTTLTPAAWIEAATQVLVDRGIDHVRVDVLAHELGVTRGSFYWHFRDREDLLKRVLAAWSERSTALLTQRLKDAHGSDPQAQVRDVISLPFRGRSARKAARIELAIRAWARRDETARAAVDEADAARLGYHRQIFGALGFPEPEARARAFLLYGYEVAESILHRQGNAAERQARAVFVERLLCAPLPA
jgi:AcrR family transcriptional regulator